MQSPRIVTAVAISTCLWLLRAIAIVHAADSQPLYKTKYHIINIHRHCTIATEAAMQAELEVIDRIGVQTVTILDAGGPDGNLPTWMKLQQKHPDRVIVFMKPSFAKIKEKTFFTDLVRDVEKAAKMGARGVKVWKDIGMSIRDDHDKLLKIDDPRLDPFWEKCGELGLPVLIHTADEKEYWYPLTPNSLHYGLRTDGRISITTTRESRSGRS